MINRLQILNSGTLVSRILLGCILTMWSACSKKDAPPPPELIVSLDHLQFPATGGAQKMYIKSNTSWAIQSTEPWASAEPAAGSGEGTLQIDVTVTENKTTVSRTAILTISAGALKEQVKIEQDASAAIVIAGNSFTAPVEGRRIDLPVEASGPYTVNIKADWILEAEGSTAENRAFIVLRNPAVAERKDTIRLVSATETKEVEIIQSGNSFTLPADKTGMSNDAMSLAGKIKIGWNLGNALEATSVSNGQYTAGETLWGNPRTSRALIDAVKAAGFNAVRIPCAWSGYITDPVTFKIKDSWLLRVREVVDYCLANQMYAIINIHWDGGWLEENPTSDKQAEVNKKQKALWEQIAIAFRDYDERLLFAGTNEVHAGYGTPTQENITVQQSYNQTFVDAVRSTGGKNSWRSLVVQAYNTNIQYAMSYLNLPEDATANRLMVEVHFYDPWDFAGDETSDKYLWGKDYAGNPHTSTWGQEAWVDDAFGSMKTKFIDQNIPVILGEYAATFRSALTGTALSDHIAARNYYLNYVTKAAKANEMVPFYWDNGNTGNNGSGLFNRTTGTPAHTDAVNALISGAE